MHADHCELQIAPSYHVLGDNTEALHIEFDPAVTSYAALLDFFWLVWQCRAAT